MSLPDCEVAGEFAYDMCPGRDIGYHDVLCVHWDCKPKRDFPVAPPVAMVRDDVHIAGLLPYDAASAYEVTLTTTKDDPQELRDFLKKIVESKMYAVKAWEACIELQENGMPHIHAIIYSDKKYCDGTKVKSRIKYPYRYKFARVRNLDNYLKYIHKENDNLIIQEYCEKKVIPQFWNGL